MTTKSWSDQTLTESFEVAQRELNRILEPSKNLTKEFSEFDKGYFEGISLAKTIINRLQEKNSA